MENPIEIDDLGVALFSETSNLQSDKKTSDMEGGIRLDQFNLVTWFQPTQVEKYANVKLDAFPNFRGEH